MAQLKSNFKNMVLSLSLISAFAAVTLASVYSVTKEPIETSKIKRQQEAIYEVLPPDVQLENEPERVGLESGDTLLVYKANDSNNQFVAAAVETVSHNGYSGDIRLIVGFDKEGNIINYSVLEQKETPGLGTKVVDWFKTDVNDQSIIGKNPASNKLTVKKEGGEVDAITAATISSRAFLEAVNKAYNAYAKNTDATTGATTNATTGATTIESETDNDKKDKDE
ncbi:MAG TPA: RnfABCDGE type electron transport complex subunit G [Bacteroidales bacterium]|nr:RnfABCDGE type electron transport complex subunit G [Bacteroidales bacterium]